MQGRNSATEKGRLLGDNVGRMGGVGAEKVEIFMQLGCSRDLDTLLQKSPERCRTSTKRHLGAFQLYFSLSRQSRPLCVKPFSLLVSDKSLILK